MELLSNTSELHHNTLFAHNKYAVIQDLCEISLIESSNHHYASSSLSVEVTEMAMLKNSPSCMLSIIYSQTSRETLPIHLLC